MLSIKPRSNCVLLVVILLPLLLATDSIASSAVDDFISSYIFNYEQQKFADQVPLVKNNKALIPEAVRKLIQDAQGKGENQNQKMYLLNMASSLASMHMHQNGDDKPLSEVEPIIKEEVAKMKAKLAEVMKWRSEERVIGNFVMMERREEEKAKGLAPVLYPHWQHRIFFECKVCHTSIFRMKRWSNDISQEKIAAGEQCGRCHNGTISFSATDKKNCGRCHVAATSAAEGLHNPAQYDQAKLKKVADRIGSKWRPENLPDGKMPLDKWGFIDWLELKRRNVFTPLVSLDSNVKEETRDGQILFRSSSDFVDDVLFDHRIHSDWITCDTCHPEIFIPELGANKVKMIQLSKGRFCGHCHGKVSFTFANCKRCHAIPKHKQVEGALVRPGK